jgi:hypothetical protein
MFWVFLALAGMILIGRPKMTGLRRALLIVFVTAGVLSGMFQGVRVFQQARYFSRATQPMLVLTTTLDMLIRERGREPGFSFYVHPAYPGNYLVGHMFRKPGLPPMEFSFVNLLYQPYVRSKPEAKYKFLVHDPVSGAGK